MSENKSEMKKTTVILSLLMGFIATLNAWELSPFDSLPLNYGFEHQEEINTSLNPALFNAGIDQDYYFYQVYNHYSEKEFAPRFISKQERVYGASFYAGKALDEKSVLTTAFRYNYEKYQDMSHSLEKNFYQHYFSFTDTTRGNMTYHGPLMWIMYNRKILPKIRAGIEVNYGIERGLKDEYTECMTIFRNASVKVGLAFIPGSERMKIGLYGRYFNRQGKYEAVDKLILAENYTYIGFHRVRPETPGTVNNKSDFRAGAEGGLDVFISGFILSFLDYNGFFGYGIMENDIDGATFSKPQHRGYWVRNEFAFNNRLTTNIPIASTALSMEYGLQQKEDWARLGSYDILALTNDQISNFVALELQTFPAAVLELRLRSALRQTAVDFVEYTGDFNYQSDLKSGNISIDAAWHINVVSTFESGYKYSDCNPWYYWDTESITSQLVYVGWRMLTTRGVGGIRLIWRRDWNDAKEKNDNFGIMLSIGS